MAAGEIKSRVCPRRAVLPITSCSIDWITATVEKPERIPFADIAVRRWQTLRAADGYPVRSYVANGYIGEYVDGITWGQRSSGAMVRLSGELAQKYYSQVLMWATNVSRLDFQVTVQDNETLRDWVSLGLQDAAGDERIKSGMTQWQTIKGSKGGSTLYIGRRSSSRLLRIYNKTVESDGLWPATSWRFEVEYKPPRSERWATRMRPVPWTDAMTRDVVAGAFEDYGIALPAAHLPRGWTDQAPREPTTDERRLAYLRTNIKPMVKQLLDTFDIDVIADAIGFYDNTAEVDEPNSESGYSYLEPWRIEPPKSDPKTPSST